MPRQLKSNTNLSHHLNKMDPTWARRQYKSICEFASNELPGTEVIHVKQYTYLTLNQKWYARLFAQKTMWSIDVQGEFDEYPKLISLRLGGRYKDGVTFNYHLSENSKMDDLKTLVSTAWEREKKLQSEQIVKSPERVRKVLFCNIGWMKYYQGIPPDKSDRIEGGGKYITEHKFGFEILNFRPFGGRLFGYVQPVARDDFDEGTIRIERIGASPADDSVDGVTVIFVSKSPYTKRRRIVGWYKNATVFKKRQTPPKDSDRAYRGKELGYYVTAIDGNQHLLAEFVRDQIGIEVPTGKGGMGRSNVWYADGEPEQQFVHKVLSFIGGTANDDDIDEIQFQAQVQTAEARNLPAGPIERPGSSSVHGRVWKRDPSVAKKALVSAGYSCMLDRAHKTFTSRATGENYVEAHHLVPMGLQDRFKFSLDVPGNVVALCPNCHRLLHQGSRTETKGPLSTLFNTRGKALIEHGIEISLEELLELY